MQGGSKQAPQTMTFRKVEPQAALRKAVMTKARHRSKVAVHLRPSHNVNSKDLVLLQLPPCQQLHLLSVHQHLKRMLILGP